MNPRILLLALVLPIVLALAATRNPELLDSMSAGIRAPLHRLTDG